MLNRILHTFDDGDDGPLIIVIAALHGNEWVGIRAMEKITPFLKAQSLNGRVVGLVGNLDAAQQNKRYLHYDLNRMFQSEYLNNDNSHVPEWHQARALIDAIEEQISAYPQATELHLLDVHSMSGDGIPFTCFPHTERNEQIAHQLPLPAIADLVESLPGTLTDYYKHKFTSTMVVECGQHDADNTTQTGIASILYYLGLTGVLRQSDIPDEHTEWLLNHCKDLPRVFTRVQYRHHIAKGSGFKMQPGYDNLQPVKSNDLLATEVTGEVRAPCDGRVVLPCYQEQGEDGFFISVDE